MLKRTSRGWFRFLENSSYIRSCIWKYRTWIGLGLLALVMVDLLEILPPILLKQAVDVAVEKKPLRSLLFLGLLYFAVALIQAVCRYLWRMYLVRASVFAGRDLRQQYAEHVFQLSPSFFDQNRMGDLMSVAVSDVEAVRVAIGTGLLFFADALFYLATVPLVMFYLSPKLTLLVCLPLPLVPWIVIFNEKKIQKRFEEVQECFGRISAMTQEGLQGIRVIKALAKENVQIQRMKDLAHEYLRLNLKLARVQTSMGPSMDLCMSAGMVLLIYFGGSAVIRGDWGMGLSLGTFVAFQRYIQKMIWPMSALGMAVNYYQRGVSSSSRLKRILMTESDVGDAPRVQAPRLSMGKIEIKNLNFTYPGSEKRVLKNISLVVEPAQRVALVGLSGSGKSTLLSLLPRLYPVARGSLWIDGQDVNDWPLEFLRSQIGYVTQESILFSGSIEENLGLGLHRIQNQDSQPLEDRLYKSAQLSALHQEILAMPSSYQTRVGEKGVSLSGGQKQRLSLARALVTEPSILILDDPFASVDVVTEDQILKQLDARPERNTELIVAHRISTVKSADHILVFQAGEIVESGSHSQLIQRRSGVYRKFYDQQQISEEIQSSGPIRRQCDE
ncbi:MAG: ABC transporter ATP-binding protein [Bdellovibrionia bacterium]